MKHSLGTIAALAVLGVFTLTSCANQGPLILAVSPDIPAAAGTVKVTQTDNGNSQFELEVEHLASPDKVNPGATVYVVWLSGQAPGAELQNMGALRVDNNLKGSFTAITPLKSFNLMVTAEPSQTSTSPTGRTLLTTSYPRR